MRIKLFSNSNIGKWAFILLLLFIVLIYFKFLAYKIPLPSPMIALLGVAAMVMGIVSFIKHRDRSILTLLTILVGLLIVVWVAAEIMYPH